VRVRFFPFSDTSLYCCLYLWLIETFSPCRPPIPFCIHGFPGYLPSFQPLLAQRSQTFFFFFSDSAPFLFPSTQANRRRTWVGSLAIFCVFLFFCHRRSGEQPLVPVAVKRSFFKCRHTFPLLLPRSMLGARFHLEERLFGQFYPYVIPIVKPLLYCDVLPPLSLHTLVPFPLFHGFFGSSGPSP